MDQYSSIRVVKSKETFLTTVSSEFSHQVRSAADRWPITTVERRSIPALLPKVSQHRLCIMYTRLNRYSRFNVVSNVPKHLRHLSTPTVGLGQTHADARTHTHTNTCAHIQHATMSSIFPSRPMLYNFALFFFSNRQPANRFNSPAAQLHLFARKNKDGIAASTGERVIRNVILMQISNRMNLSSVIMKMKNDIIIFVNA
jgi:hypothetical protein